MTTTAKHRYIFQVLNESLEEVDFWVKGGRLTIDQGQSPYIQGELVIKMPDSASFALLDPRTLSMGIFAVADGIPGPALRLLLLSIRSREYGQNDDEVVLKVAGFESWLLDFAPLEDDLTPFTLASSLRDIVDYVLGVVGSSLIADVPFDWEIEATPAVDADMTPYWTAVNMLRNPAVAGNLNNWSAGSGCTIAYAPITTSGEVAVTMTAGSASVFAVDITKYNVSCVPGETYTFSLVHKHTSASGGSAAVVLRFLDANNGIIQNVVGTAVSTTTSFERISVTAVAPPSAVKVAAYWAVNGGTGRTFRLDGGMLYAGRFTVAPFTGGDSPSNGYSYAFEGPTNDSASVRTPDVERDPEALVWRAGQPALDFLLPLMQSVGLRLVFNGNLWTLRDETYEASGALELEYGVNLVEGSEVVDRDAGLWYDAQVTHYTWTDRNGTQREVVDSYADGPTYNRVNVEEKQTPFPGPGYSEYAVRRALQRGREFTVTAMSDWAATAEQPVTITLQGVDPQEGVVQSVEFDLVTDEMTVKSRAVEAA